MLDETMTGDAARSGATPVFVARLLTAVVQAVALYLLTESATKPFAWPATDPYVFAPLLIVAVYVPLLLLLGLGQMRVRPLACWAAIATVVVAGLGYHAAEREQLGSMPAASVFLPPFRLWFALSAGIFIGHVLVVDSLIERRCVPPYPRHFDTAWKQGLQAVLAAVFVSVFWGVLHLGAGLFKLVDIGFFQTLIGHSWFAYPATTLALAVSLHVTDVQPSLIRGVRSVALTLFSWLLPLLAVILLGFLGSLPFISLAPLWRTHFATTLLLFAAALLVFLINSAYQDGAAEQTRSRIKRVGGTVGAVELVPLVGLAAWALGLRVRQYGWTVERILAAGSIVLAACYAIGYASATVRAPAWLKRIEFTNLVAAYAFLALILLLFSPIADPARLMVTDQMARLRSGGVAAEKFDFAALKFDGARWGAAALTELKQLKEGPDAAAISAKAAWALALTNRYQADAPPPTVTDFAERVVVLPEGRKLPAAFYDANNGPLTKGARPVCFQPAQQKCVARFINLRPGEADAILFLDRYSGRLFEQDGDGQWHQSGYLAGAFQCARVAHDLEQGEFSLEAHGWPDLVAGDQRVAVMPMATQCPANPAAPKAPAIGSKP